MSVAVCWVRLGYQMCRRPKLMTKPIVVIAPLCSRNQADETSCFSKSTFYSTTTGLSPTKGRDALEEANPTCKQRPNYVELSTLISVSEGTAAAAHSSTKSQPLNWTESDVRGQGAKPISSPTPSKAASLLVDPTVAQYPDTQSHKHDYSHPGNPSYIQLSTLIAGGSGTTDEAPRALDREEYPACTPP
ncbi:hypothetical protein T265_10536 [Opisthorchis viverrini]|uniref:Uncharacterized protein n=1 Tax=Opisthorchis viverrini TaxID=6198 RepID=A0A074Z253_OPIVI|nr:hypothetical protein T265_10536 [Opisthorchis viverrini]KER21068.1 hypothetical protein T265_10536 [Opisthorchis viverrini]